MDDLRIDVFFPKNKLWGDFSYLFHIMKKYFDNVPYFLLSDHLLKQSVKIK